MPKRNAERIYLRVLPGGGFVAIEAVTRYNLLGQRRYHGHVIVERRAQQSRRLGHQPPAVAYAEGSSVATLLDKLFPITQSNAALAAECLCATHS